MIFSNINSKKGSVLHQFDQKSPWSLKGKWCVHRKSKVWIVAKVDPFKHWERSCFMVYCIGAGILYVMVLVATLRILKRSAILRDKAYVLDDAAQAQKGVTFSSDPEYGHIDKQFVISKESFHPGRSVSNFWQKGSLFSCQRALALIGQKKSQKNYLPNQIIYFFAILHVLPTFSVIVKKSCKI